MYDEETEEFIGNVEELSGEIANLTKTASTPGGISLFIDDAKTEYKSTYQLLKEISEIYNQLSDKDQAGLLEALAGKRQGQIIAATINNFEAAEKAMDSMAKRNVSNYGFHRIQDKPPERNCYWHSPKYLQT